MLKVSANLVSVPGNGQLAVSTDSAPAIKAVIADVSRHYPAASNDRVKPKARLGVLVRDGTPTAAWEVKYMTKDDHYRAFVDAATNEVLSVRSLRKMD